jgi:hypothetical protein
LQRVGKAWACLHLQGWGVGWICLLQPTKQCCWGNNIRFGTAWTTTVWIFHGVFFGTLKTIGHGHPGQMIFICSVGAPILVGWIVISLLFQ